MKFTRKIKKFVTITLTAAMILLNNNSFTVHAQDISQVTAYKPGHGMVSTNSGSGVNVRNAPNLTTSEIIRSLPNETLVMIVGQSGDFYKVQYDTNGHYGYMFKDYVIFYPQDYYLQANTTDKGSLNMYYLDSTSTEVLATIPNMTYFAYLHGKDTSEDFYISGDFYMAAYGNEWGFTLKTQTKIYPY